MPAILFNSVSSCSLSAKSSFLICWKDKVAAWRRLLSISFVRRRLDLMLEALPLMIESPWLLTMSRNTKIVFITRILSC